MRLSAGEWNGPLCDEWSELREGAAPKFGHWDIEAAADGDYAVTLYLFPPEAGTPLDGGFRAAPARPVRGARLRLDASEFTQGAASGATHVRFQVPLRWGARHRIEGQLLDAAGQPLWGAIYVLIERSGR